MRVISGKYKGKNLTGFDINGTRPTMDRVKESMFGSIQLYIKESTVLDLFAGSGSLGIEALSNGAQSCYFVDHNKIILDILDQNLKGIDNAYVIRQDYNEALLYFKNNNIKFDVILLDPPYSLNLINDCIEKISKYDLLNENGIIVCEYETEHVATSKFKELKSKKYSTKHVTIYKFEI